MIKILFISKYLSINVNGHKSRLATLIEYFKKNNHDIAAITSSRSLKKKNFKINYKKKKFDNVDYFFLKDIQYSNFSLKRVISWIYFEYHVFKFNYKKIKFKPDIIYVSSLSLFSILNGIILKKKFNAKLVFEMRDLWPYYLYTTGKFNKFNPIILLLKFIEKLGVYHSNLVISLAPKINDYLKLIGFKNKKSFSSTFPLDKKLFKIKNKYKIKLNKEKFNICYAGNFGFDNHLEDLLKLVSNFKSDLFFFHLIGNGSQKAILKNKYSHFLNIKFYNEIPYKELHSVLSQMDCLVVSFGFKKKFPTFGYELNKLNNYLMASKPIIVLGDKKNLSKDRGDFIFVTKDNNLIFEKKLFYIKDNYRNLLKIAKKNKNRLIKRNNPKKIFIETVRYLNKL